MGRVLAEADSIGLYRAQTDSFPFSAESSFRELDDVFLQTQTRIWLGEVLKTRLDEETSIADLLADGILLFEVSKVIWKMLLTKFMKLRSSKAYFSKLTSRKNKGRYMPYSNVDSFLKICQILGLTGIDLFSPSDVVEKRDIRRVCMCIRSLSKKSRSKDINVPDFDVVTYTVAMSTDMVKGIRNSLEQSQCRFSENSSGCSTYLVSRPKYGQKNWGADFARHYDSYSEASDDIDSNYQVVGFDSPTSTTSCGGASLLNLDVKNSPRGSSVVVENFHLTQCMFQTNGQDEEIDGLNVGSYSPSPEAKGSLKAYHLLNDNRRFTDTLQDGRISPSGFDYVMELSAGTFCGNKIPVRRALNTSEDERIRVSPLNLDLESRADHYKSERNVIGQCGASNKNGRGTHSDESAVFCGHGKDFVFDLHKETNFHGPDSVYNTSIYQRGKKCFEEIADADVSSTAFPDLVKADTADYEDKFEGKVALSNHNIQLTQQQKKIDCHIMVDRSTLNTDKVQTHLNLEEVASAKPLPTKECQLTVISSEGKSPEASEFLTPHGMSVSYICKSPFRIARDDVGISYAYPVIDDLKVSGPNIRGTNEEVREDLRTESTSEALNATTTMVETEEEKCRQHNRYTLSMVNVDDCVGHHSGRIILDPCIQASRNHLCKIPTFSGNDGREVQSDQHVLYENELVSAHQACTSDKEDVASSTMPVTKEDKCSERDTYTLNIVNVNDCVGHHRSGIVLNPCIQASENHLCNMPTCSGNDGREVQSDLHILDENELKSVHLACTNHKEDVASSTENLNKDKMGRDVGASDHKRHRTRLLKSFAGGISVFGVFLLLFHLRRPNGKEKINETSVPSKQIWKTNKGETSAKNREQKGRSDGVYPAEKLRF